MFVPQQGGPTENQDHRKCPHQSHLRPPLVRSDRNWKDASLNHEEKFGTVIHFTAESLGRSGAARTRADEQADQGRAGRRQEARSEARWPTSAVNRSTARSPPSGGCGGRTTPWCQRFDGRRFLPRESWAPAPGLFLLISKSSRVWLR
jgi:hypothetical protein